MIKILFFIPTLTGGGAEKVLCNLVNNMDKSQFDITVQTIEQCKPEKFLADGIHYKAVNRCKTAFGRKIFFYWFRLCAELKLAYRFFVKDNYDIEVAYLETIATKIIAQSCNKSAAKIAWVHCDLSLKANTTGNNKKLRNQYAAFDRIVCVSHAAQRGFHKLFGANFATTVLHNVIDDEKILELANQEVNENQNIFEKRLIAVGRLSLQKNFKYLIDTCGNLRDAGYQFHLSILGEGPERENLEKQIENLNLTENIELRGFCENPYPYMKNADIIVCSSLYEGLSTVIQEALILGKPVVTTPCTGMKELLGDSEYGLIAEDSENGLFNALSLMFDNRNLEKYYGGKATERKENFEKKNVLKQTEEMFHQILMNKAR